MRTGERAGTPGAAPSRPEVGRVAAAARLPWPVALYLFCVVIPIGFDVGSLQMTTLRLMLLVVTVPLMVQVLTGRYGRIFATDILFVLHILWAGVALAVNNLARISWRWWLLVGLGVFCYVVIDLLSNRTPIEVLFSYATFSPHTGYWRLIILEYGLKNVWSNPVFGIGLNDWERPWYMYSSSMDNFWLVMAVRYGIPGFLFVALGYVLILRHVIARNFATDPVLRQLRMAWVFTFMGLTFTLCTVHVWTNLYSFVFFIFGAGVWLILAQPAEQTSTEPTSEPETPEPRRARYTRFPSGQTVARDTSGRTTGSGRLSARHVPRVRASRRS